MIYALGWDADGVSKGHGSFPEAPAFSGIIHLDRCLIQEVSTLPYLRFPGSGVENDFVCWCRCLAGTGCTDECAKERARVRSKG